MPIHSFDKNYSKVIYGVIVLFNICTNSFANIPVQTEDQVILNWLDNISTAEAEFGSNVAISNGRIAIGAYLHRFKIVWIYIRSEPLNC